MPQLELPQGASLEDLRDLLELSPRTTSDIQKTWVKSPESLHKEFLSHDVSRIYFDPDTGIVGAKTSAVALMISDPLRKLSWVESSRTWPNGKTARHKFGIDMPAYSMREHSKKDESPLATAVRCLRQEAHYEVQPNDRLQLMPGQSREPIKYDSSVYLGVHKEVMLTYVELWTTNRWYEKCYAYRKNGRIVYTKDFGDRGDVPGNDDWVLARIVAHSNGTIGQPLRTAA